jgi:hypothetical protein
VNGNEGDEVRQEPLFDLQAVRVWGAFLRRSLRRHWFRAGAVGSLVLLATAALVLSAERQWVVTSTVIAQSSVSLQSDSKLYVPSGSNAPSINPADVILAQDNLVDITDRLGLVHNLQQDVSPLTRLLSRRSSKSGPKAVKVKDVVARLRSNLQVTAEKDSIRLSLSWVDPQKAVEIVQAVEANFLADRERAEIGPREAAQGIIRRYKEAADAEVTTLTAPRPGPTPGVTVPPDPTLLRIAQTNQQDLAQRLEAVSIDLDAARAAYRFRYTIATPPQLPESPASGGRGKLVLAGLLGAFVAGSCVATATDLLSAKVVEPWQVTRRLGLPLLAELRG